MPRRAPSDSIESVAHTKKLHLHSQDDSLRPSFRAASEEFARAKGMYARKTELLEQIVHQQRTRLEQINLELARAKKEARI